MKGTGLDPDIFLKILNSTYFRTGLAKIKDQKLSMTSTLRHSLLQI